MLFEIYFFWHPHHVPGRKKSFDIDRERRIAARLREARERLRMEQAELAALLGLTRDQWQNLELGRTLLPYRIALKLHDACGVSLDWLSGMPTDVKSPDMKHWRPLGPQNALEKALFSDVALELNVNVDRGLGLYRNPELPENFPDPVKERAEWVRFFRTYITQRFSMVAPNEVGAVGDTLLKIINQAYSTFERHPVMAEEVFEQIQEYVKWLELQEAAGAAGLRVCKKVLTDGEARPITGDVKVEAKSWVELKRDVLALLERREMSQADLARLLNFSRQKVYSWLSGDSKPTADATLALFHWWVENKPKR